MIEHGPILPEDWYVSGANRRLLCDEPCCEMRRVEGSGVHVEDEDELREALTKPEVFWW